MEGQSQAGIGAVRLLKGQGGSVTQSKTCNVVLRVAGGAPGMGWSDGKMRAMARGRARGFGAVRDAARFPCAGDIQSPGLPGINHQYNDLYNECHPALPSSDPVERPRGKEMSAPSLQGGRGSRRGPVGVGINQS
jgi:hypothetical protein